MLPSVVVGVEGAVGGGEDIGSCGGDGWWWRRLVGWRCWLVAAVIDRGAVMIR